MFVLLKNHSGQVCATPCTARETVVFLRAPTRRRPVLPTLSGCPAISRLDPPRSWYVRIFDSTSYSLLPWCKLKICVLSGKAWDWLWPRMTKKVYMQWIKHVLTDAVARIRLRSAPNGGRCSLVNTCSRVFRYFQKICHKLVFESTRTFNTIANKLMTTAIQHYPKPRVIH